MNTWYSDKKINVLGQYFRMVTTCMCKWVFRYTPKTPVSVNCCEQRGRDLAITSSPSVITAVHFLSRGAVTRRNDVQIIKIHINNLSNHTPAFSVAISNAAALKAAMKLPYFAVGSFLWQDNEKGTLEELDFKIKHVRVNDFAFS